MRAALLLSIFLVLLAPFSEGSQPVVPTLTLTIDPPSAYTNSTPSDPVNVSFYGTATVDKLPAERAVVTLGCAVNVGWQAVVTPTEMIFTSTTPQQFNCTVTVPQGTPNMTGAVTVIGRIAANNLYSTASVSAQITVRANWSPESPPGNPSPDATARANAKGGPPVAAIMVSAVVLVAAVVGAGAYLAVRRRRGRITEPE